MEVRVRGLARQREPRAAHAARAHLARRRRGRRHGRRADVGGRGHDRALHHRPHRVLAQPADHVRGRRLRRWRPAPRRAHRRGRRRPADRRPGGDDLSQAVHRRRHPQLLLESATRSQLSQGETRMASHGIKDQVAIVGMGCTPFGEHWHKGTDDLLIDAAQETFASAGVTKDDVDAYWLGTAMSGMSGMALARPLQLHEKPVTHVENFCATASEAIRNAAYAVASGAYDSAMAIGVEKVKDSGYQGLNGFPIPTDGTNRTLTAAAMFSMVAPAYAKKYGVDRAELKKVLARIASKNRFNGARNP